MTESVARFLISWSGLDMEQLSRELEKLFSYTMGRQEITAGDIREICTLQLTSQIFAMVDAVAEGKQKEALDYYYSLLTLKEPPMRILFLIGRQFSLLVQVKELRAKGYDNRRIGEKTGLHGFIAGKYVNQSSRFEMDVLKEALADCVKTDEAVKNGRMNDRLGVEMLIIRYSGISGRG